MKYYNSCIEYVLENGMPKSVKFEYWFIPYTNHLMVFPPTDLKTFAEENPHSVLLSCDCAVTVNPATNSFEAYPVGYLHAKVKRKGYGFSVMIAEGGAWKTKEKFREFYVNDELTINEWMKPREKTWFEKLKGIVK